MRKGHRVFKCGGEMPFIFCSKCGAWAARRSRKLSKRCGRPTAPGSQALARIQKGLHPSNSVKYRGKDGRREQEVRVEATFDGETLEWVRDNRCKGWRAGGGNRKETRCQGVVDVTASSGGEAMLEPEGEQGQDQLLVEPGWPGREEEPHEEDEDVFGHGGGLDQDGSSGGSRKEGAGASGALRLGSGSGTTTGTDFQCNQSHAEEEETGPGPAAGGGGRIPRRTGEKTPSAEAQAEGQSAKRRREERERWEAWRSETAKRLRRAEGKRGLQSVIEEISRRVRSRGSREDTTSGGQRRRGTAEAASSSSRGPDQERTIVAEGQGSRAGARIRAAFARRHLGWSEREAEEEAASWVQVLGGEAAVGATFLAEARGEGWLLSVVAPRRQCVKLSKLPLEALSVGGLCPKKVGGVEVGMDEARSTGEEEKETASKQGEGYREGYKNPLGGEEEGPPQKEEGEEASRGERGGREGGFSQGIADPKAAIGKKEEEEIGEAEDNLGKRCEGSGGVKEDGVDKLQVNGPPEKRRRMRGKQSAKAKEVEVGVEVRRRAHTKQPESAARSGSRLSKELRLSSKAAEGECVGAQLRDEEWGGFKRRRKKKQQGGEAS